MSSIEPKRSSNGFDDLGIAPNLLKAIQSLNFTKPTPIQKKSIPAGLAGDDIIAIAQTGSGKTIAFGIPMLQRFSKSKRGAGLVLVPTRELALQVDESIRSVGRATHIRTVVLIGGAAMSVQRIALKKNPRIIVATPGRLMDHIERRTVNLSNIEMLVLDEADRMLDMGFLKDIKKIMKSIPDQRQTMMFSATMPKEIEAIAAQVMENPTRIEVDRSGATPTEVSHEMFMVGNHDKARLLAVQLKQCPGPVLVFTRTKRMASKLTLRVRKMGFSVAEIHSNRSLAQRRYALEGFKSGRFKVLIATDIAARGIDVSGIAMVVNYDMPANSEDYVHRIGRTGRAGKQGLAVSFATREQRGSIRSLERFMKTRLTIADVPNLPSDSQIYEGSLRLGSAKEQSTDEMPAQDRRPDGSRAPRRSNFRKPGPRKSSSDRFDSKRKDTKRPKRKRSGFVPYESDPTVTRSDDSGKSNTYQSHTKKNRPPKKKSVGQGSPRKKRRRSK